MTAPTVTWQPIDVEWEQETIEYLEAVTASVRSDLLAEIDAYTDHGIAKDVQTWAVSPARIEGVIRAAGHDVTFYVESRNGQPLLTIADIEPLRGV